MRLCYSEDSWFLVDGRAVLPHINRREEILAGDPAVPGKCSAKTGAMKRPCLTRAAQPELQINLVARAAPAAERNEHSLLHKILKIPGRRGLGRTRDRHIFLCADPAFKAF